MGTRVPQEGEVRLRIDTTNGYDASILVDLATAKPTLGSWLEAQLSLIKMFGPTDVPEAP